MPSGYPYSKSVRPELFHRVCGGAPLRQAAQDLGVSRMAATIWWREAGAVKLRVGWTGGVASSTNLIFHRWTIDE